MLAARVVLNDSKEAGVYLIIRLLPRAAGQKQRLKIEMRPSLYMLAASMQFQQAAGDDVPLQPPSSDTCPRSSGTLFIQPLGLLW